jgi:hypothetical protein
VVEKRWRVAWEAEGGARAEMMPLPADYEVAAAFAERRRRFCLLFFLSLSHSLGLCFGELIWILLS